MKEFTFCPDQESFFFQKYLEIQPTFPLFQENETEHTAFLFTIRKMLESVIPVDFWLEITKLSAEQFASWPHRLIKHLPLLTYSFPSQIPGSLTITYLCPAEYTHGVGRYVIDTLSRWLIPGKNLYIAGSISLNFQFQICPSVSFYLAREIVGIHNTEEAEAIRANLPSILQEIKLNILAVYQARYIASLKSYSNEQKNKIIQETLISLLNLPSQEIDRSLYDQMHGFLLKLSSEEKIGQVKKNIAYLQNSRPKAFDRDVFYEMTYFTILFRDQFSSRRDPRHISRVIALHYLFRKGILNIAQKAPLERHLSIKICKTQLENAEPVLGILVGMNFLRETEQFERRQLLEAIRNILPDTTYLKDSFIADRRDNKVGFYYLEVQKPQFFPFALEEIRQLRLRLSSEIKKQIENAVHPIFMPRNEEELLRNLIILCKQLKYVRDLPQISIHYEKQTDSEISFTLLMARLLLPKAASLRNCFAKSSSSVRFSIDEVRDMGMLKKKYSKEASIIKVTLNKSLFFRQDFSVDLVKARQKIVSELTRILGEFRDYNGGMILRQDKALDLLQKSISPLSEERRFLLENYFYSLRPGVMQTVHDPLVLKGHFLLLEQLLEASFTDKVYHIKKEKIGKFQLFFIGALASSFKEWIHNAVDQLKISSYDLTTTFLQIHELSTLGYILRTEEDREGQVFEEALFQGLQNWEREFSCPLN